MSRLRQAATMAGPILKATVAVLTVQTGRRYLNRYTCAHALMHVSCLQLSTLPPPRFCFCAYRVSPALGLLGRPSDARVQTQPGSDYLSVMTICLHPVPTRMRATTKKRRGRPDAGGQDCSMAWWWCWAGTSTITARRLPSCVSSSRCRVAACRKL